MSMSAQHFWSLPKQHGPNSTLPENSRQPRSTAWHPYPEKPSKRSCELWHVYMISQTSKPTWLGCKKQSLMWKSLSLKTR
ncbi:hypothetical protein FOXYSP1_08507 [Fusarium oxysporum f. sp. phaseoli]